MADRRAGRATDRSRLCWNRRRAIQAVVALVVAVVPFMVTIPAAFAGVAFGVTPTFPSNVTVGQAVLNASLQIVNNSTPPENTSGIDISVINLVPACGVSLPGNATGDCPAADADPGVFTVSSTATGEAKTACAGIAFTVAVIDSSTGQVSFTPSATVVLGPANGSGASSVCRLDFTFSVLKAPTKPAGSSPAGTVLTDQVAFARGTAVSDGVVGNSNGSSQVSVALAAPSLATTTASAGGAVGAPISDSATLSPASPPGPAPTGTITFDLYGPGTVCTTTAIYTKAVTVTGTGTFGSGNFTPTSPGAYEWTAAYSGDANNVATVSACGSEPVSVAVAAPTITTTPSPATTIGGTISDSATLTGGFSPTGTITFSVYGPGNSSCTGATAFPAVMVPVSGNGTYASGTFTPTASGTYHYVAAYSGDPNNGAVASACASESTTVNKATPTIMTTASGTVMVGGTMSDNAVFSGGLDIPTGSLTFKAYANATCTGTPPFTSTTTVAGNGTYSSAAFTTKAAGTYEFVASYSGDANNDPVVTACGAAAESVSVTPASPTIATHASAPAAVGNPISDTATLSGGAAPTGTITFRIYGPNDPTCAKAPVSTSVVPVTGDGSYTSVAFSPTAAGTYNFVAAYSGDANNLAATSGCGATNESVTVSAPPGGAYTTVAPARDLDTRTATGGVRGPIAGNTTFNLTVTGVNGVPAIGVGAVALNVTVTDAACTAWLTVFPAGQAVPASSNLNYTAGETVANLVVVGVGAAGQVAFNVPAACAGSVQVIADVQGWYAAPSTPAVPGGYTAVAPARDLDTRDDTGGVRGPVAGNSTFNLTVTGVNGVPATGVGAVALNVTVTASTCAAWLTVFTAGQAVPASSNLNYTAGQTVANLVVVGVSSGGLVSFNVPAACHGSIQVIADVQGWYAAQTAPAGPGSYTPLAAGRDLDTRNGTGGVRGPVAGNSTFNLTVTGVNGVPATGVGAVALNVTVTDPTCAAWLTVFPAGQAVPGTSNMNYAAGQTVANLVVVGVSSGGQVSFNVPAACHGTIQVIADIQGWYGPTP